MCFIATIVSPLRSKRVRISPVRRRSKASGLTRIRVRSISLLVVEAQLRLGRALALASGAGRARALGGDRGLGRYRPLLLGLARRAGRGLPLRGLAPASRAGRRGGARRGGGPPGAARARLGRSLADLGLAVGADLPARVERPAAGRARLLEPPQAARAAQEVLLDLEAAVLAVHVLEVRQARLGR